MWRWVAAVAIVVVLGFGVLLALSIFGPSGPPHVAPPAGFTGGVEQSPAVGVWRATGTTTSSAGYFGSRDVRRCKGCSLVLTIEHADGTRLSSPLTPQEDGWHATFNRRLPCKVVDRRQVTWNQRSSFVFRFRNGGRRATGHQVNLSYAKRCGYATSREDWTAVLATAGAQIPAARLGRCCPTAGTSTGSAKRRWRRRSAARSALTPPRSARKPPRRSIAPYGSSSCTARSSVAHA